jgi:hypothetical protein
MGDRNMKNGKLAEELQGLRERMDSHPDVTKIRDRRTALLERKSAALEALAALQRAHAAGQGQSAQERKVQALVEGREGREEATPEADQVREGRRNVELLDAAISVLNRQESELRTRIGLELGKGLRPSFAEEWRRVALAAVRFSEEVAALEEKYDSLRSAGIPYASALPVAAPLGWCNGRDRDSKVNRFIDEIVSEYGLSVPRKVLEEAEAERSRLHMASEARKAQEKAAQEARWAQARKGKGKKAADGFVKVV